MPGAQVRSRRDFVMSPPPPIAEAPKDVLGAALRSSRVSTALPVGVSTHTLGRAPSGQALLAEPCDRRQSRNHLERGGLLGVHE